MLLLSNQVLELGLDYIGLGKMRQERMSESFKTEVFHWHYGSSPLVVATIWYDMCHSGHAVLQPKDKTLKGFKHYMVAMFFLWVYPRNAGLTMTRFDICEKYCRGKKLWYWIEKISELKEKVIKWDPSIGSPNSSAFAGSIDCVDCKIWEIRHNYHENTNPGLMSQKINHAGVKYEIVMDITKSKCMSVVGPIRAGQHDMNVFRLKTKEKMKQMPDKMLIADKIYKPGRRPEHRDEVGMFAIPNTMDIADLKEFKSRLRARHETFNGRLKFFAILRDCFRSANMAKHGLAFNAVCTIVQYQCDNGSPIFGP